MMNLDKLKAVVNNVAKTKNIPHQTIYDAYFFERFLNRVAVSKYKNNFIFKGGFLLSNFVGLETRSTYDIDLSYKEQKISVNKLMKIVDEIISIKLDDGINYNILSVAEIMTDKENPRYSVKINVTLNNLKKTFHIDIAGSDVITPGPIVYKYNSLFGNSDFSIISYNKETIIAEKFETIISKGTGNSRAKDLFDLYLLTKENFDKDMLHSAIISTFESRKTNIKNQYINKVISEISNSHSQITRFNNYAKSHYFANNVSFDNVIQAVNEIKSYIKYIDFRIDKKIDILLLRHGTDMPGRLGGWSDNNLTAEGIREVNKFSDYLNIENEKLDFLISSDLNRAKETAKILAEKLNINIIFDENLREINNGILKNMSLYEFKTKHENKFFLNLNYEERYPEGESPKEFYERVKTDFMKIIDQNDNKKILVVTHGGVIGIIKSLANGIYWDNKQKYVVENCECIRMISIDGNITLNEYFKV